MKRPRLRVWHLLAGLAFVAAGLGVVRHRAVAAERAELARLRAELVRAEGRMKWTDSQLMGCFRSTSLIALQRRARDAAKKNLEGFRPLFLDVAE